MRKRYQKPMPKKPLKPTPDVPTNGDLPQDQDPEVDQSQAAKWVWEDEHLIFEGEEEPTPDEEDEEGQGGVPKGKEKGQGPVPSKTKASHEYVRLRPANKFEKKASFASIEKGLDDIQDEARSRLIKVVEKQRESMLAITTRKQEAGTLTAEFVTSLDLKHKAELNRVARSFLQEAYRVGRTEGRSMIPATMQVRVTQGIPPEAALQFFEDKAFWISGVLKDRLLNQAKAVLFNAIKTGEATSDTVEKLQAVFEPYVGNDRALDPDSLEQLEPYRLETIIRTNATEAFNEGLKDALDPEVASGHVIAFEYSAILDGRTTEICRHLDGQMFRPDSPSLQAFTPPNHFTCRSLIIPVTKNEGPVRFITQAEIGKALDLKGPEF